MPSVKGIAIGVSEGIAFEVSLEVRTHAMKRAIQRLGRDIGLNVFVEFEPTTLFRDGLRQWRNANGEALMMRESFGSGWASLTVITTLGKTETANTTIRNRPYRHVEIPPWLEEFNFEAGIHRGQLLRAIGDLPNISTPQIAKTIMCSESHVGTWLGELVKAGLVAKAMRRNGTSKWRLKQRASLMLNVFAELPEDVPEAEGVDVLRRQLAEEINRRKVAEAQVDALRAKCFKLKTKAKALGARLAKYIDQEQMENSAETEP